MAVMSDGAIDDCWADFMRTAGEHGETFACLKPEGRAMIVALDAFVSSNAAAINSAIPQPARSAFSTQAKARALIWVVRERYLVGA